MSAGDFQQEAEALRLKLVSGWTRTSVDWSWFNSGSPDWGGDTPHIRPAIQTPPTGTRRAATGPNARRRAYGLAVISVFRPLGEGDINARADASALEDLFRDYEDRGVTFNEPTSTVVGPDPEGRPYYQINVTIPFRRDRIV